MVEVRQVENAIAGIRAGYQSDGYDLVLDRLENGVARFRVTAESGACAECLIPKPIAIETITAALASLRGLVSIELEYPS
jgi:hypothetical protein